METSEATAPESVYRVNVFAEHSGGCYTCRHFGERVDVAVSARSGRSAMPLKLPGSSNALARVERCWEA